MGLSYGGLADSPDDCVLWESTPDTLSQAGRKNTSIAEKLTPVVFSIGQSWGLGDALTDQCSLIIMGIRVIQKNRGQRVALTCRKWL